MVHRPVAFGVKVGVEIGQLGAEDLPGRETVLPHQKIRLVKPVLPQKRRLGIQRGQQAVRHSRDVGRVKHALQAELLIHGGGQVDDLVIALGAGPDDHLRGLPGRGKPRRPAAQAERLRAQRCFPRDLPHRRKDGFPLFVGSQAVQAVFAGQLHVDAHAVGQQPQRVHQFR
ncbi:hypothetical protein SDC9_205173 [bioreactor metagenome]|uniref:Uncharacterized protein n=1 Tax=bioreactor metagenome TaxID=1076179 RepID=A0A645J460_9ZZZZ